MDSENQTTISWEAPEFRHYPKNPGWYITLTCISLMVVVFFIIQRDFFAAVSLAIISGFVFFFARQTPEIVPIELNNRGVHFGNLRFPYKQIKHFWVVHNENHKTLNLHTTALLNNIMILELEDQDPEVVRMFLIKHLPEHEESRETPIQRITHRFKF